MSVTKTNVLIGGLTLLFLTLLTVSLAVNPYFSLIMAFVFVALFLIRDKIYNGIVLLPLLSAAFIPSLYIDAFRISSPLGDLRPPLFIIPFIIIVAFFYRHGKIDYEVLKNSKGVIFGLSFLFLTSLLTTLVNGDYLSNFRYFFYILVLGLGVFLVPALNVRTINPFTLIKGSLFISSTVCVIGLLEFNGIQPYASSYLASDPQFAYDNRTISGLPRIVASIGNPLVLSYFLLMFLPAALYVKEKEKKGLLWDLIILLHIAVILLTFSRSALLVMVAILAYHTLKKVNLKKVIRFSILGIIVLTAGYTTLSFMGVLDNFIDRMLFHTNSSSISIRIYAFSIIPFILNGNYILGVGTVIGDYLDANSAIGIQTLDNLFLTVLVSSGGLGLLAIISVLLYLFFRYIKLPSAEKTMGISLLIVFIGAGMSFDFITFETVWSTFWFFTGLLFVIHVKNQDEYKLSGSASH